MTGVITTPPWKNVDDGMRAMSKGGCLSILLRADDVTRAMSKGGGGVLVNVLKAAGDDVTRAMSKGVEVLVNVSTLPLPKILGTPL